jgi:iron(III) transport system permease protein
MTLRELISKSIGGRNRVAIAAAALLVAAPIAATFAGAFASGGDIFWSGNGSHYVLTTLALLVFVAIGVILLGAGGAFLTAMADFPGRSFFSWALVLPFAVPAYVAAYAYGDFLGPFGPAASIVGAKALPEIRSLAGAVFILTLTTYPYVYLAIRASLAQRSTAFMEAARSLGASPLSACWKVLLAAGRPALIGGLALALMETAADYGVADYFGVPTLSVGIFRTWYGLGDLVAATQLAVGLFLIAALLVLMEEAGRRGLSAESARTYRHAERLKLSRTHGAFAIGFCALILIFGFVIPAGVLAAKLDTTMTVGAARGLFTAAGNTAIVAAAGALIATVIALLLALSGQRMRSPASKAMLRIATLGYAIPGAVIAIGVLALSAAFGRVTGAAAGGVAILLYAYVARFLTAGYNAASGGLSQISPQMEAAAKSLGAKPSRILAEIHWPLARGSILAGATIIIIDIAKELPATLLLRPFNFETLSTHIYRLASDERLADAAPAALILIALSLVPTIALGLAGQRKIARESATSSAGDIVQRLPAGYSPPR